MYVYMEISKDQYELPLLCADSLEELSKMCGVKARSISKIMYLAKLKNSKCKYIKVKIDEKED